MDNQKRLFWLGWIEEKPSRGCFPPQVLTSLQWSWPLWLSFELIYCCLRGFSFSLLRARAHSNSPKIGWTLLHSFLLKSFPWKQQPTPSTCLWFYFLDSSRKKAHSLSASPHTYCCSGCHALLWEMERQREREGRSLSRWSGISPTGLPSWPIMCLKAEPPVCKSLS